MAIDIELSTTASPAQVLEAIRENVREWHESVIPRDVWDSGVIQVLAKISAQEFRLYPSLRYRKRQILLAGTVRVRADGRTGISARCETQTTYWLLAAAAGVAVVLSLAGKSGGGALIVIAIFGAFFQFISDNAVSLSDPVARYLVERLKQAIAEASAAGTLTSPNPDAENERSS